MKKLAFVLFLIMLMACNHEPKVDYAILSGNIENADIEEIMISSGDFEKIIKLDNGIFKDTLNIGDNGFYSLRLGIQVTNIYLENGNDILLTVNAKEFAKSITYSGIGAIENEYLAANELNDKEQTGEFEYFFSQDEDAFKDKVMSLMNSNKKALEAKAEISQKFVTQELRNLTYDSYVALSNYEAFHSSVTNNSEFRVSDDFLPVEFKTIVFDNTKDYNASQAYSGMAYAMTLNKVMEGLEDLDRTTLEDFKPVTEIKIPALKNKIVTYLSTFVLSPSNENLEEIYTLLVNNTTEQKTKDRLKTNFDLAKTLKKGTPSPTFENYENHKGGVTSLSDLKGKYVYIDVWASWCVLCIAFIPHLEEVRKKYRKLMAEGKHMDLMKLVRKEIYRL